MKVLARAGPAAPLHRGSKLLRGVDEQRPAYVSVLASFLHIVVIWTDYHATFRGIAA
jgi:hypothetical protein